jgi:hypothetical protein
MGKTRKENMKRRKRCCEEEGKWKGKRRSREERC